MCGIVGFNWEDKDKIRQLADMLSHRGPEQQGHHVSDGISLGHNRWIIRVSSGQSSCSTCGANNGLNEALAAFTPPKLLIKIGAKVVKRFCYCYF